MAEEIQSWVLLAATVLLAGTTIYYALQNRKMADAHEMIVREMRKAHRVSIATIDEMKRARESALQPYLRLSFEFLGPLYVMVRLTNVGPGAAVDIAGQLIFRAVVGSDVVFETSIREWRAELLHSGDHVDFYMPDVDGSMMNAERVAESIMRIEFSGSTSTVLGDAVNVAASISDIANWWESVTQAQQRLETDPLDKIASNLEKERKALEKMVSKWTATGGGLLMRTKREVKKELDEWREARR